MIMECSKRGSAIASVPFKSCLHLCRSGSADDKTSALKIPSPQDPIILAKIRPLTIPLLWSLRLKDVLIVEQNFESYTFAFATPPQMVFGVDPYLMTTSLTTTSAGVYKVSTRDWIQS